MAWWEAHADQCWFSCLTLGEMWKGIHLMPDGKRKKAISGWAAGIERDFAEVCLPLDSITLKEWGKLCGKHQAKGSNLGILDSLIAATAIAHDLIVVTRNTKDFPREVKTFNPWADS